MNYCYCKWSNNIFSNRKQLYNTTQIWYRFAVHSVEKNLQLLHHVFGLRNIDDFPLHRLLQLSCCAWKFLWFLYSFHCDSTVPGTKCCLESYIVRFIMVFSFVYFLKMTPIIRVARALARNDVIGWLLSSVGRGV